MASIPSFFSSWFIKNQLLFMVTRWKNYLYIAILLVTLGKTEKCWKMWTFSPRTSENAWRVHIYILCFESLLSQKKLPVANLEVFGLGFPVAWNGGDLSSLRWDRERLHPGGVDPSSQQMTRRGDMLVWKQGNYQGLIDTHNGFP